MRETIPNRYLTRQNRDLLLILPKRCDAQVAILSDVVGSSRGVPRPKRLAFFTVGIQQRIDLRCDFRKCVWPRTIERLSDAPFSVRSLTVALAGGCMQFRDLAAPRRVARSRDQAGLSAGCRSRSLGFPENRVYTPTYTRLRNTST
jgi:hypothetical protein